jgi:hypothetical protein
MTSVINPHDKLFRETWSDPTTVRGFLQQCLPPALLALIDLSRLEICKDSFVEKDLRDYFSDTLYAVRKIGLANGSASVFISVDRTDRDALGVYCLRSSKAQWCELGEKRLPGIGYPNYSKAQEKKPLI